ncbi:MAG: tRNA pseudouridine(38-40) synthase TruA [Planctomycetes bacterium]|nr:tRNA pseudouridine(38-40) synthase TruA [Planctomycetota bacterium]
MRNVRLQIAYDGSRFHGWQRQEGFYSVQEALEDAYRCVTGDSVVVHGAGRTDTGVHALRQVAHVHVETRLEDDRLRHALNAHLAEGVVVRRLETCRDDFHARFDARGKRYMYVIATARFRPPFGEKLCHWCEQPLDLPRMRAAASELVGEHDFSALASSGSPRRSNVRRIQSIHFIARRERLAFVVEGNGFLYNMVRTIAGTLIQVGRGKVAPSEVREILESRERKNAGPTAPPEGLYLVSVLYDEPVFARRDRGPRGAPGVFQY